MDAEVDAGNFTKARSFLLSFSSLLLVLWYFKAKTNSLSILGNSVEFTANTEHVWLVLSLANAYFLLRFIQHLPPNWNNLSAVLRARAEPTLIAVTTLAYHWKLRGVAREHYRAESGITSFEELLVKPVAPVDYYVEQNPSGTMDDANRRPQIRYSLGCKYRAETSKILRLEGYLYMVRPNRAWVIMSSVLAFARSMLFSPWFTEHVLPMAYGVAAVGIGFWRWCQVASPAG